VHHFEGSLRKIKKVLSPRNHAVEYPARSSNAVALCGGLKKNVKGQIDLKDFPLRDKANFQGAGEKKKRGSPARKEGYASSFGIDHHGQPWGGFLEIYQ